jgi:hypothetical protein
MFKKMTKNMKSIILGSIDWISVRLGSVCAFAVIIPVGIIQIGSVLAIISTLTYNGIRIYKELKNKK